MNAAFNKDIRLVLATLGVSNPVQNLLVEGLAFDSRQVKPGFAFFCLSGQHFEGMQFAGEAASRGAACIFSQAPIPGLTIPVFEVPDTRHALAVVADYFYGQPSRKLRPIGVTGTNGKTTTTHLVEHIFNFAHQPTALLGTLGIKYPGQSDYKPAKHTTPESSDLHRALACIVSSGSKYVAMEVSSHALVQSRVEGCQFAIAALTNITQDHLDFHKTMEAYWRAKLRLFEMLNESCHSNKSAIINLDDAHAQEFLAGCSSTVRKLTYGLHRNADLFVQSADINSRGTNLKLGGSFGAWEFNLPLPGKFNVYNTLAALLIAVAEGISPSLCIEALANFNGVAGRFQVVSVGQEPQPLCIVDYAHTPDGLENVLKTARELVPKGGKLMVVFGCGGDRDVSKRPQMGEIAERIADSIIVTSDNPRSEDPQQIIANILAGIKRLGQVKVEPDRANAIALAVQLANINDVLVVAGKGHENYQILAKCTIDFDDRIEVTKALEKRKLLA